MPFPSPEELPDPGIKCVSCVSCIDRQILYHLRLQGNLKKRRSERGGQQEPDRVGLYTYDKDLILGVIGSHWGGFENDRAQLLGVRLWTGVRGKLRLFFGNGVKPEY